MVRSLWTRVLTGRLLTIERIEDYRDWKWAAVGKQSQHKQRMLHAQRKGASHRRNVRPAEKIAARRSSKGAGIRPISAGDIYDCETAESRCEIDSISNRPTVSQLS